MTVVELFQTNQARHFLKRVATDDATRIWAALDALRETPVPAGAKRLAVEKPTFSYRVGSIRILYRLRPEAHAIDIIKIDKRSRAYD